MLTFLEYFKGNEILNPNFTNGKKADRAFGNRQNVNTKPKEYKHKDTVVDNATHTPQLYKGLRLQQLLQQYNTDFTPNTSKVLGNSNVEVEMFEDEEGQPCGRVKRRVKNGM